ncbi:MAG: hypothetical protein RMJ55_20305, partial [Roseiflexaceae bacterium]|nr:hypothetical protein [Roseiflexaceae bacterium]
MHPRRSLPALALVIALVSILGIINLPADANVIYPSSAASVYLPFVTRPASVDLVLSQIEITQSVQNSSNTVSMVASRPTVARAYVTISGAAELSG